jgi:hypothetical protein
MYLKPHVIPIECSADRWLAMGKLFVGQLIAQSLGGQRQDSIQFMARDKMQ